MIIAADRIGAVDILIITTVSGRAVLRRDFEHNQWVHRRVQAVMNGREAVTGNVVIVSWAGINNPTQHAKLLARYRDLILVDEATQRKVSTPAAARRCTAISLTTASACSSDTRWSCAPIAVGS